MFGVDKGVVEMLTHILCRWEYNCDLSGSVNSFKTCTHWSRQSSFRNWTEIIEQKFKEIIKNLGKDKCTNMVT